MAATFTHLLLATEHSEFDRGAEALAFALARRCRLPLAAVLPVVSNAEYEAVAPQIAAQADAQAAARLKGLCAAAEAQGIDLSPRVRHGPEPFAEIIAEAQERDADLLVIRRRGRRGLLANLLIGDMVNKVIAHAPCSTLVVPREARLWSRGVLVGFDPTAPDPALIEQAARLAVECSAPMQVLTVVAGEHDRAPAERVLAAALVQARAAGASPTGAVRRGRPHEALIDAAREAGADLIVVGRRATESLAHAWIGGVAQKVIGLADCAVLVHVNRAGGGSP